MVEKADARANKRGNEDDSGDDDDEPQTTRVTVDSICVFIRQFESRLTCSADQFFFRKEPQILIGDEKDAIKEREKRIYKTLSLLDEIK